MAKKIGKLARRYARALIGVVEKELGREGDPPPALNVAAKLDEFAQLWLNDRELSFCLLSPSFEREQRIAALMKISALAAMPDVAARFLKTLCERDRLEALPEIVSAFRQAAEESAGVVNVEVETASEVSPEERHEIEKGLGQYIQGRLRFNWNVNQALYGGLVVKFQGKVLDGSLSGRLDRLERSLNF